jgi:acetyl esterase
MSQPHHQPPEPVRDYGFLPADVRAFIARTESFDAPPGSDPDTAEVRRRYDAMCAVFELPHPPGLRTEDLRIAGVPCRRYRPSGPPGPARVVYFHGGGFVVGGLYSHDSACAELAAGAGLELIAVDYRLAPEHRHPAAYDDACAVVAALSGPLVLAGDSAGGTLAAAVAGHGPADGVLGQVLIYPGLGGGADLTAMHRHDRAPLLHAADIATYHGKRAGSGDLATDPTALPLIADSLAHLPPTALFAAACDPLASDCAAYAARLAAAGVPVALTVEPDLVHGYLRARHVTAAGRAAFARITAALTRLGNGNGPR